MKLRIVKPAALIAAALLVHPLLLSSVGPTQPQVFKSGVELIDVAVVVRDRDGRFVHDLTAADFQVLEEGVPQTIAGPQQERPPAGS